MYIEIFIPRELAHKGTTQRVYLTTLRRFFGATVEVLEHDDSVSFEFEVHQLDDLEAVVHNAALIWGLDEVWMRYR